MQNWKFKKLLAEKWDKWDTDEAYQKLIRKRRKPLFTARQMNILAIMAGKETPKKKSKPELIGE